MPLPEPVPDLATLDLLVTVGQTGSISAAASAHGITQPGASTRLRNLERTLGIKLLERSATGTRLTTAGNSLVEWSTAVLNSVQALQAGASALREDQESRIRLGASLTVADYLLPGWLHQLSKELPGIRVSLQMGNTAHVVDMVAEGRVEIGFIEGTRPSGRRFRSRELASDRLVVVVGAGHPWARRRTAMSPSALARAALIVREPGSGTREVLAEALASQGYALRPSMELGSTAAIKAAAMRGAGPAVLSELTVEAELRAGQLVSVPYSGLHLERTIRAIWPTGREPGTVARRLLAIADGGRSPGPVGRTGYAAGTGRTDDHRRDRPGSSKEERSGLA